MALAERATWFGPIDRPRFGWLTIPDGGTASVGVVLCPPMAEEARATHRTFRRLGLELAGRGMVALRIDYDGTGDSAGALSDADRLQAWLDSITDAVDFLRAAGVTRICAVGMRLGATLASVTPGLHSVALWDPCASGTSFLREGEALHALGADTSDLDEPGVHTPGFVFSDDTASELRTLLLSRPEAERVLVLTRPDRPLGAKARARLDGATWSEALGQPALLDVLPSESQVPQQSLDEVVGWIAEASDPDLIVDVRPNVRDRIDLDGLVERPVRLGPLGLFGVVTEPASPGQAPWLVLLNVAAEQHIGPGRRWVEFSRRWAGLGFRCLRVDLSGVGESPAHPGQDEDVAFAREWIEDVPQLVDELSADGSLVALIGLCSGAYSALEAALHTKVDSVCAVNPRVGVPELGAHLADPRRRAARAPVAPLARLSLRYRRLGGGLWRIYRQIAVWHAPMAVVRDVVAAGTDVMVIANPKDAAAFREVAYWTVLRRRALRRTGRFAMQVVDELDHSMLTRGSQDRIEHLVTDYVVGRYGERIRPVHALESGPWTASTAGSSTR